MRLAAALLLSITTPAFAGLAAREVWLPIAGRALAGDGRMFLTTVTITNSSEREAAVTLSYFSSASPNKPPRSFGLRIAPRSTATHELGPELVLSDGPTGALRITSDVPIEAAGRVHSGTVGSTFNAIPREMAIASGESTRLRSGGAAVPYRLYAVETKGHPLYFAVRLFNAGGRHLGSRRLYLSALEQRAWNFNEAFTSMEIEGINGSGAIIAAGSATSTESRDVTAFEMELPSRPRHGLGWPERAAYGAAAAVLLVAAVRRRHRWRLRTG